MPLALFLFMICAILTSIVLAASTAVSGRQAQLVENDQRYYSVASAAECMKQVFGEETVFQVVHTETYTTTVTTNEDGSITYSVSSTPTKELKELNLVESEVVGDDINEVVGDDIKGEKPDTVLNLPQKTSLCMLLGGVIDDGSPIGSSITSDTLDMPYNSVTNEITLGNFEIAHNGPLPTGANAASLKVNGKDTVQVGGGLRLSLRSNSASGSDSSPVFSLTMYLEPEVDESIISATSETTGIGTDTETTTETITRRISVKWIPTYISKAEA